MTTHAIIGAGIAGRSLIYTLAKEKKNDSKIIFFDSDSFAHACSMRSTAIVAPRGVSAGHSPLGDLIAESFQVFQEHVLSESPAGVFPITQYTAALSKLEQFQKRYPSGRMSEGFEAFSFKQPIYTAEENAFLIDPAIYLKWLMDQAQNLNLEVISDFVISHQATDQKVVLKTQSGKEFLVDHVTFAGGVANRFWGKPAGRPAQGSYLEFSDQNLGETSFSLTLEGDNLIYHAHTKKLLIGSTTSDTIHELAPFTELHAVYDRLQQLLAFELPRITLGVVQVGLREKAAKREPYWKCEGQFSWIGGFYKNGYSLGINLSRKLISLLGP